jgi:hypothetical protein
MAEKYEMQLPCTARVQAALLMAISIPVQGISVISVVCVLI